ncbi:MAG: Gfo/Idh/MocA family oxidoreductase [Planctomycetota bacterium]
MTADSISLAVIGLGGWGQNVARCLAGTSGSRLAAICDIDKKILAAQAGRYPGVKAVTDCERILSDSEIDAVAIAAPTPLHAQIAEQALKEGKHVFVEKPMALSVSDAEALVRLSEEKRLTLMVGHLLEYHPAVGMLKNLIDEGELGEIFYIYCQRLNLGVVRRNENSFWSLAPHDISIVLYFFGAEPTDVSARGEYYLQDKVEDVVFVNLKFPDRRMAQIHVSWLDPHKERRMVVVGSKKMAVFDDMQAGEKIRIYDKGAEVGRSTVDSIEAVSVRHGEIRIPLVPGGEPLAVEAQHFVDCVRTGKTPRSDGRDGLRVVRVLAAATESMAKNGTPVEIKR